MSRVEYSNKAQSKMSLLFFFTLATNISIYIIIDIYYLFM